MIVYTDLKIKFKKCTRVFAILEITTFPSASQHVKSRNLKKIKRATHTRQLPSHERKSNRRLRNRRLSNIECKPVTPTYTVADAATLYLPTLTCTQPTD